MPFQGRRGAVLQSNGRCEAAIQVINQEETLMAGSTTPTQQFKVVGTRPIRHDGLDKVVGRAKYGADYSMPEMLHGKVLRSHYAHARIKSINAGKALRMPGVKAVITYQDFAPLTDEVEFQYGGETAF